MSSRIRHERRLPFTVALVASQIALAVIDIRSAIVFAPAALWLAVLFAGYRPGEKLIERIAEKRRRRLSRRPVRAIAPLVGSVVVPAFVNRLAALDLAMRPPPAPSYR